MRNYKNAQRKQGREESTHDSHHSIHIDESKYIRQWPRADSRRPLRPGRRSPHCLDTSTGIFWRRRAPGDLLRSFYQSCQTMGESGRPAAGAVYRAARTRPFHIIPVVDTLSRSVDQRVRVASVTAESTLTRDTVPVNVDAIVFWVVWNAEKSILEVEDFVEAITLSAQTALRESIGRHELAQMITERESLGRRAAADSGREDQSVGHHRAIGRDPRRADSAGTGGRDVAPGAGRARTPGAHHPGPRPRLRSPTNSRKRPTSTRTIPLRCICAR